MSKWKQILFGLVFTATLFTIAYVVGLAVGGWIQ